MRGRIAGMRLIALAWIQFFGGVAILFSCDYYVRWRDGWLGNTGTPTSDVILLGVPLVLGFVAIILLWRGTKNIKNLWLRLAIVSAQAIIGFLIYSMAALWYVVDTGIDSL